MATTPKVINYEEWLKLPEAEGVEESRPRQVPKDPSEQMESCPHLSKTWHANFPEVWVVSPEAQTVEVMLLKDGRLSTAALLREGQLKPVHFPGAAVDIALLWPR